MSQNSARRRGRPIGTGIDDSDRLAHLDELLRNRPELKPTTAIRHMGFSDPSVIRRLRDKYKSFEAQRRLSDTDIRSYRSTYKRADDHSTTRHDAAAT